ncbi:MAG: hypothetical protein QOJ62_2270 [Actinomycetota bacterium]|nr:hypothetical protein [Actinomycetota bacterium]
MSDRLGPFDPERPDDEIARRLRDALSREARAITPSGDGLARIREKVRAARRPHRAWLRGLQIAAAATATAAIAVVAVVVVQNRHDTGHPSGVAGPSSATPTPTPSVAPSSPVAGSSSAPTSYSVWVFYVGKLADPQQLLFREMTPWPTSSQHTFVKDAVNALLATKPQDPDYVSYWPAGTKLLATSIKSDNTTAVVDLSAEALNGPAGKGDISIQQLLYTIQHAAPKITALELRIGGQPVTSLWGSAPITQPVAAKPTWEVWAHVWINAPTEHATVASSVTISGEATVFEATVSWEIRQNGGRLRGGPAQASLGAPDRGVWSQTVALAPGTYSVRAWETSAKDGSITYLDDKEFTVS